MALLMNLVGSILNTFMMMIMMRITIAQKKMMSSALKTTAG